MGVTKLVLLRHGESTWNKENKFTGWTDVDLSDKGRHEAGEAGKLLASEEFTFDVAYTSVLKRAIRTLWSVLDEMDLMWIPVYRSWRLNERHYGGLQGLDKSETAAKFGDEQVLIWRRSYNICPPELEKSDARYPGQDPRYKDLSESDLPLTESLESTVKRFIPYWNDVIAPEVRAGKKVLIAAHGNSLRALVKHLDNISEEEILKLNIPTGVPLVYELDDNLKPIKHYYLGDPEAIKKAAQAVANQGKSSQGRWFFMSLEDKQQKINKLREQITGCKRCELHLTRTNTVPGEGDVDADIMFIGEAPGRNEDLQGKPFVGRAGDVFDKLLASVGLTRDQIYLCNILKCRPPKNRNPLASEILACVGSLDIQIKTVNPKVIGTLGNFATTYVFDKFNVPPAKISSVAGKTIDVETPFGPKKIVPVFHPAVATYNVHKTELLISHFQAFKPFCPEGIEKVRPESVT